MVARLTLVSRLSQVGIGMLRAWHPVGSQPERAACVKPVDHARPVRSVERSAHGEQR